MQTTDKQFFLRFLEMLFGLILLTIIIFIIANLIGAKDYSKSNTQIVMSQARIEPIGKINLASNPTVTTAATTVAAAPVNSVAKSGEEVYNGLCVSCHAAGIAQAPIVGNIAQWETRIAQGIDALYAAAINGKGLMAAKGGNPALSDDEVKHAVDYMVEASQ